MPNQSERLFAAIIAYGDAYEASDMIGLCVARSTLEALGHTPVTGYARAVGLIRRAAHIIVPSEHVKDVPYNQRFCVMKD